MNSSPQYVLVAPESKPSEISRFNPFRAVIIAEQSVTASWQALISNWLVQSGCLYMIAWGNDCSSWDDSLDIANLEAFNFGDIPEDRFVMTTWHANETLDEVLWFAKHSAFHPSVDLQQTLLIHISATSNEHELLHAYNEA